MVQRAIRIEVQPAIRLFCNEYKDEGIDQLDNSDWSCLHDLNKFLGYFEEVTLSLEGKAGHLGGVLTSMDFLLEKLEYPQANQEAHSPEILSMCESAWQKLIKYYNMSETSEVYVAALVLDPRYKWSYFEKNWQDWVDDQKGRISQYWQANYQPKALVVTPSLIEEVVEDNQTELSKWHKDALHSEATNDEQDIDDEYELYCSIAPLKPKSIQPVDWWRDEQQQAVYPNLSRWALDILSIPAMSDDPERLFSRAKHTLTPNRSSMAPETLEALECVKSWGLQKIGK